MAPYVRKAGEDLGAIAPCRIDPPNGLTVPLIQNSEPAALQGALEPP